MPAKVHGDLIGPSEIGAAMRRIIICDGDSAAGNLKAARIAERVFGVHWDLADRPAVEAADLAGFFRARHGVLARRTDTDAAQWMDGNDGAAFIKLLDEAAAFDRLELWCRPDIGGQLALCAAITEIGQRPLLAARTSVLMTPLRVAEMRPEETRALVPEMSALDGEMIVLAGEVWKAFRAPTPEPWRERMDADLSALPHLRSGMERLIAELPDVASGLSVTQRALLECVAKAPARLIDVIADLTIRKLSAFGYWRMGEILAGLCSGERPAIAGTGSFHFTLDMHQDAAEHRRIIQSVPRLTAFGEALLKGAADYMADTEVDEWWCGTHLIRDDLWRWDAARRIVIPPR